MAKKKNWLDERLEQETDEGVIENLLYQFGSPRLYDEAEDENECTDDAYAEYYLW